jgi:hypothetical protein
VLGGSEEKGTMSTASGNVNWYRHTENYMEIPQKLKIELPCDTEIPL